MPKLIYNILLTEEDKKKESSLSDYVKQVMKEHRISRKLSLNDKNQK